MNKKYKWALIIALVVIGGVSSIGITKQPKKLYNTLFSSPPAALTEQDYINYLKKHEKEITTPLLENHHLESIQWDWDSVRVGEVGNGTPQGGGLKLNIEGGFNHIENSGFVLAFDLKDHNSYPDLNHMFLIQDLRIGGDLYE